MKKYIFAVLSLFFTVSHAGATCEYQASIEAFRFFGNYDISIPDNGEIYISVYDISYPQGKASIYAPRTIKTDTLTMGRDTLITTYIDSHDTDLNEKKYSYRYGRYVLSDAGLKGQWLPTNLHRFSIHPNDALLDHPEVIAGFSSLLVEIHDHDGFFLPSDQIVKPDPTTPISHNLYDLKMWSYNAEKKNYESKAFDFDYLDSDDEVTFSIRLRYYKTCTDTQQIKKEYE